MRHRSVALLFALGMMVTASTEAGTILTVGSKQLQTNTPGFVDVSISSDSGAAIDSVSYEFLITRVSGPGFLRFGTTNANDLLSNPNYVFNGVSTLIPGTPYGSSSQTSFPSDTFLGGDSTQLNVSGDPINATVHNSSSPQLLTRLPLIPDQVTLLSSFRITLVPLSGKGVVGEPTSVTTFNQGSFSDVTVSFDSSSGIVTIGTATVPEPGTLVMTIVAAGLLLGWRLRGRMLHV